MDISLLFSRAIKNGSRLINYQSLRWRRPRKPFWLGLAKSKMFVNPKPEKILPPEERNTYNSLLFKYNTEYKSILNFIRTQNPRLENITSTGQESTINPALEEKISLSLKANEEFNAESRRLGEEWMEKFMAEESEKALKLLEIEENEKLNRQKLVDEIIRKEKALSEEYITPENLDEAIEKCLKSTAEFDFAIDLQGNRYYGRKTLEKSEKPTDTEEIYLGEKSDEINSTVTDMK